MEFYQELLLTALVSLLLAFLLGKVAAPPAAGDAASVPAAAAVLKRSRTSEKRVRFREPAVEEREEREELLKDLGSDAVNSEVSVGDEFGKENMLSIASTEVSLVNDARLEVNLSDVACELNIEEESRDSVNEGGSEGESVAELQEMEIEEADVELAMQEVETEEADVELAINATKMEAVESVEFDIETGSRVGDGSHELEGESVTEIVMTGKVDAMVEMLVPAEPDIKVESRDWDVNQENEAGLEGEVVAESQELPKGEVVEVESGDRDASQGNESVASELVGALESSMAASEQNIEFGNASQVNAAGLEGELVIESSAMLEIAKSDAESARDAVKEEIIELLKSSSVVYQLDIEKNSIPVVSQVKEAGLEVEIKNVNVGSATCVAEEEETIIIRSPETGGVEESGSVESVESLVYQLNIENNNILVVSQVKEAELELEIRKVNAESATCVAEEEETIINRSPESGGVESVESLLHGEDEWEGIQRSDVEKLFGVAASYTSGSSGVEAVSRLSSDVQMELYGLHKVATEGPCYEPQPLALMVTARAKWHAWQRLGSMNPEVAMEQYISLLTLNIPDWMGAKPGGNIKQEVDGTRIPDSGPSLYSEPSSIIERESEDHIGVDISSAIPTLSGQDST